MRNVKAVLLTLWYLGGVVVLLPGLLFLFISYKLGLTGNEN